ncbi:hypothetical protein PMAYCL1PPCAC_08358, partial [Pristionchus mayeri]
AGYYLRPIPAGSSYASMDSDVSSSRGDSSYRFHTPFHRVENDKQKAFVAFMHSIGLSPHMSTSPWSSLSDRSQRRQAETLRDVTHEVAKLMNENNPKALKEKAFKCHPDSETERTILYEDVMMNVKEAFESSDAKADRLAYMSMIAHFPLSEVRRYIPGLTRYYFNEARKYARRGYHYESVADRRVKYIFEKVERFIQFLLSYKCTLGLPFGTRRVRDSHRRFIEIPNTLRKLRSGEIYQLYKKELEENGETSLLMPESTIRKMIHICSAERRKSLHGVDATVADAMEVYDNAETLIERMYTSNWIDKSWHDSLLHKQAQGRQYLRTDYLIHTKEYSQIGSHCWTFALSEPDDFELRSDCSQAPFDWGHKHTQTCSQCEIVKIFFDDLRAIIDELEEKHKDNKPMMIEITIIKRDIDDWETKISNLRAHQLRVSKSEKDKEEILGLMTEGDVMWTADWAMKLLPMQPR